DTKLDGFQGRLAVPLMLDDVPLGPADRLAHPKNVAPGYDSFADNRGLVVWGKLFDVHGLGPPRIPLDQGDRIAAAAQGVSDVGLDYHVVARRVKEGGKGAFGRIGAVG